MPEAPRPPRLPSAAAARLAPALVHLGLAAVVSWPLLLAPRSRLLGSPDVDIWNHAWGPWWWAVSLAGGELPWQTRLLQFPEGGSLWFIDPVLAGLGAPLVGPLGPALAVNLVLFAYVLFASWAGRFLARSLGAGELASWAGAVAFAGSAWLACELHNGITEAANIGPVALALGLGERAAAATSRGAPGREALRRWALAGLGVGLAALASPYLGLAAGLALLVRGLPALRHAWLGGLVALVVAAPPTLALRAQLQAADAIVKHPEGMNEQLALHNAVDPRTFVSPGGFRSVDLSAEGFEHSMYLGLLALGLAMVAVLTGLRRGQPPALALRRRDLLAWILAALVCLLTSLGPYLYWGDGWLLSEGGQRLRLPWWAVRELAPGLAVTHPLRLAVPVLAVVSGLAALGLDALLRGMHPRLQAPVATGLLGAMLLDGLVLSGAPWPLATAPAAAPPAVQRIAAAPAATARLAVLHLPTDAGATMATSRYLWWQTAHRRPIPYGPDARASTSALIDDPAFRVLAALSSRRPDEHGRLGFAMPGAGKQHASRFADLGFGWIVLHRALDPEAAAAIEAALTEDLGPGEALGEDLLWTLAPAAEAGSPAPGEP